MSSFNVREQLLKLCMQSDPVMICPYFLHASCQNGDSCQYSHDTSPEYIHPKKVECEAFLKGKCKYVKNCWFLHPGKENNEKSESQHNKDSASTSLTCSSLNVENSTSTSVQAVPKIQNRISFWHENRKRWQNHITKYPNSLKSNFKKKEYKHIASDMENCSHFTTGICPNEKCIYFHGYLCEYCHKYCVHPFDKDKQLKHFQKCTIKCSRGLDCSVCCKKMPKKQLHSNHRHVKTNRSKH